MGNTGSTLRGYLGSMCGTESAKDKERLDVPEDQRPVDKPKQSESPKKKGKLKKIKLKKKKKKKGPALLDIEEEKDADLSKVSGEFHCDIDTTEDESFRVSPVEKVSESANECKEIAHHKIQNEAPSSPEIENEENILDDTLNRTLSESITEQNKVHRIHEVEPIKPELLDIDDADKIFQKAAEVYHPFVKLNHDFEVAVLEFEYSINPNKNAPDFERCLEQYYELLKEEKESGKSPGEGNEEIIPSTAIIGNMSDINVNFQTIRASGQQLLSVIGVTRLHMDKCIQEASEIDLKHYIKNKISQGKLSNPGSKLEIPVICRRNLRQLKKAKRQLEGVENEAKSILANIDPLIGNDIIENDLIIQDDAVERIIDNDSIKNSDAFVNGSEEDVMKTSAFDGNIMVDQGGVDPDQTVDETIEAKRLEFDPILSSESISIENTQTIEQEVGKIESVANDCCDECHTSNGGQTENIIQENPPVTSLSIDTSLSASHEDVSIAVSSDCNTSQFQISSSHASLPKDNSTHSSLEVIALDEIPAPAKEEESFEPLHNNIAPTEVLLTTSLDSPRTVHETREEIIYVEKHVHIEVEEIPIDDPELSLSQSTGSLAKTSHEEDSITLSELPLPSDILTKIKQEQVTVEVVPEPVVEIDSPSTKTDTKQPETYTNQPVEHTTVLQVATELAVEDIDGGSVEIRPASRSPTTVSVVNEDESLEEIHEELERTKSFLIQEIPEKSSIPAADAIEPADNLSPSPPPEEEETTHEMMDYGKYIFIDPTLDDVKVLRERSRSLDSLVSIQSLRSNASRCSSRYGSFEFVTNMELVIAEKNQQN